MLVDTHPLATASADPASASRQGTSVLSIRQGLRLTLRASGPRCFEHVSAMNHFVEFFDLFVRRATSRPCASLTDNHTAHMFRSMCGWIRSIKRQIQSTSKFDCLRIGIGSQSPDDSTMPLPTYRGSILMTYE